MKKILTGLAAGVLAVGILATSAFAAVTFDPSTGTGFVGKGDVQLALGYNNAQLQANAGSLVFTQKVESTYEVTVSWTTGEGTKGVKIHTVDHKEITSLLGNVAYDARKQNQINGFNLIGNNNTTATVEGAIPAVGDEFPGNSGHIVTNVELTSSTSGLYVNNILLP